MARRRNKYIFASEDRKTERRRSFRHGLLMILLLAVAAVVVSNYTVSHRVTLENLRLTVLNLPDDLEYYSILHLSDLHGAMYGAHQKAIATALGDTRYSCVVMTGDMLGKDGDTEPLMDLLALMPPETPKYYIPGANDGPMIATVGHGSLSVYTDWAEQLQKAGVTLLDRPVLETRGKGRIWFVPEQLYAVDTESMRGVYERQIADLNSRATSLTADDAARLRALNYELERLEAVEELRKEFQPADMQIVLTHTPLTAEYVDDMISWTEKEDCFSLRYASLILAGDYNGGQWRLPFLGAIYMPEYGWFPEDNLVQGLDYLHGIPQHISHGLGSDPDYTYQPGRLYNPPVMTRIILTRRAN